MKNTFYLWIVSLLFAACQTNYEEDDSQRLVIEAFLYENQVVKNVEVSWMIPLVSDEDTDYTVSEAEVFLYTSEGETYKLSYSEEENSYGNDALVVSHDVTYELEVHYQGQSVYSETILPQKPEGLNVSSDTLYVAQITDPADLMDRLNEGVIVSWKNEEGRPFFVQVDNIEDTGNIVNINGPGGGGPPERFQLVTQPTVSNSYLLDTRTMEDYGLYRIVLYALNQEYLDLYETSGEDSRSFSEPLTNITNGLGIFTSFSSDTTYLTIVRP